jgi:hypothetical protein
MTRGEIEYVVSNRSFDREESGPAFDDCLIFRHQRMTGIERAHTQYLRHSLPKDEVGGLWVSDAVRKLADRVSGALANLQIKFATRRRTR